MRQNIELADKLTRLFPYIVFIINSGGVYIENDSDRETIRKWIADNSLQELRETINFPKKIFFEDGQEWSAFYVD